MKRKHSPIDRALRVCAGFLGVSILIFGLSHNGWLWHIVGIAGFLAGMGALVVANLWPRRR